MARWNEKTGWSRPGGTGPASQHPGSTDQKKTGDAAMTAPMLDLLNDIRFAVKNSESLLNVIGNVRLQICSSSGTETNEPRSGRMKVVSYLRVSTGKQAKSGLGLEAQREAVETYLAGTGGKLLTEYVEAESGKKDNRPELAKALAHARRSGAVLLVAKLDRLSRNATFLSALLDSQVDFLACDNPVANKLTIRILAAVAQEEREAISKRTKEALQAAKARGVRLGGRPGHWTKEGDAARLAALEKNRAAGQRTIKAKAIEEYADLIPMIEQLRGEGKTLAAIAETLNAAGHSTRRGGRWTHVQVSRLLARLEEAK